MMDILPDIRSAKDFVDKASSSGNSFIGTAAVQILGVMTSGARSASISTSGKSSNDIKYLLGQLNQKGYKANLSGSNTIEVQW